MSSLVDERPCDTSAFTYMDRSLFAPAQFALASVQAVEDGWEAIIDQLIDIGRLQDDWDGGGSAAIDRGVIAGAIKLAWALRNEKKSVPGRVSPSVNGTICFEWRTADGYQEIEVTSPVDAEQSWVPKGADVAEITIITIT